MSTYDFTGTVKWAKVKTPDEFRGQSSYKIDLYLAPSELKRFNALGLSVKVRQDDDGSFVKLTRKTEQKYPNGEIEKFGPPKVWMNQQPFDGLIGNGSEVTARISVFGSVTKAHRLEALSIASLVEFTGNDAGAPDLPF